MDAVANSWPTARAAVLNGIAINRIPKGSVSFSAPFCTHARSPLKNDRLT
jgi:hypothetical protein